MLRPGTANASIAPLGPVATATSTPGSVQTGPVASATIAIGFGTLYLHQAVSGRQAALFLVGVAAGVVLYHAAFGFTSAWRVFVADGRGAGVRAQMLMLALACLVFFPTLEAGTLLGQPVRGVVASIGWSLAVGAFLFGVGMQLGGG